MTFSLTIGGTDVAGKMVLPEGLGELTSAADGESNECQIIVDDPHGTMTFQALAEVIAEESAASNPRLYTGIVTQLQQSRGTYGDGPGRIWTLTITDLNERLHRRVFHAADAKRPAETGTQRLDWLLASVGLIGLVWDNGKVMANAWAYDETDYRDQYADDVLSTIVDAASAGRWTAFVYWDPTATPGEEPSLFYGEVTTTTFDSTLALSNVLSEVDDTTVFGPAHDSEVTGEAAPIYDGVDVVGPFGRLYRQLASTYATFGIHRDAVYETIRNNNLTSASLHADSFLAQHAGEVDTISCTVTLPRDKVTLITAGMRLGVYFSHLAGYDDPGYTFTRVTRCTVRFTDGRNDKYDLHLELSTKGIRQTGGGGNPGDFPHPPSTPPSIIQSKASNNVSTITPDNIPTDGSLLFMWQVSRGTTTPPVTPTGWTSLDTMQDNGADGFGDLAAGRLAYKTAASEPSSYNNGNVGLNYNSNAIFVEVLAGTTIDGHVKADVATATSSTLNTGGAITPSAGNALVIGFALVGEFFGVSVAPDAGVTELEEVNRASPPDAPSAWAGSKTVATATSTTISGTVTGAAGHLGSGGVTVALLGTAAQNPPSPGQWVYGEVVTITGTTGTTQFPYAAGSLVVRVDGVLISRASYTETDPSTGAFTLGWTKDPDEVVTVDYQGI